MNNYERNHAEGYTGNLNWYPVDTDLENGNNASKISLPYNSGAYFEYDSANKVYKRYQYGGEQIDGETGGQLTFKNVLALYAPRKIMKAPFYRIWIYIRKDRCLRNQW